MANANFGIRQSLRPFLKPRTGRNIYESNLAGFTLSAISPDFFLPLNDLGNGEVNIAVARGIGAGTFTRTSEATTVLSNGLIKKVSAGIPRSYYDPTTLQYVGYLAEGPRTNLCLQSEDLAQAVWAKNLIVLTGGQTAPDGNNNAYLVKANNDVGAAIVQGINLSLNTAHTQSVFVKKGTSTRGHYGLYDPVGLVWIAQIQISWTNDVPSLTVIAGAATNLRVDSLVNGVYRLSHTLTSSAVNAGHSFYIRPDDIIGTGNMYLWGAQLEPALSVSTYIPTGAIAVTRQTDILTYPASNVNFAEGTCYAEAMLASLFTASRMIVCTDPVNNFGPLRNDGSATAISSSDGSTAITKAGLNSYLNTMGKVASMWGSGAQKVTGSGLVPVSGAFDGSMGSALSIGSTGAGTFPFYGTIKNVRLWKRLLDDLAFQHITGV